MPSAQPAPSSSFGAPAPFRVNLADAARFWEPRRLIYNAILAAVTVSWIAATWPHFRPALQLQYLVPLAGLALIATATGVALRWNELNEAMLMMRPRPLVTSG